MLCRTKTKAKKATFAVCFLSLFSCSYGSLQHVRDTIITYNAALRVAAQVCGLDHKQKNMYKNYAGSELQGWDKFSSTRDPSIESTEYVQCLGPLLCTTRVISSARQAGDMWRNAEDNCKQASTTSNTDVVAREATGSIKESKDYLPQYSPVDYDISQSGPVQSGTISINITNCLVFFFGALLGGFSHHFFTRVPNTPTSADLKLRRRPEL